MELPLETLDELDELRSRVRILEEQNAKLRDRISKLTWQDDPRPRYDSYGQFDGYYP